MIIGIGQVFTVGLGLVNLNPAALSGLTVPSQFPSHESRSNLDSIQSNEDFFSFLAFKFSRDG